jgi:hypothetical protein
LGAIAADDTTLTQMLILRREICEREILQLRYTPEKVIMEH